ncbi:MAG: thiamine phosphate synthase, partial [Usitatibacter sp.]
ALMQTSTRPEASLVGASCHDERELDHAERIGVDYAVVGPVRATASHPAAVPLGWERFAALVRDRPMPVFAIGGLTRRDLEEARRHGAHGVALLGAAFDP